MADNREKTEETEEGQENVEQALLKPSIIQKILHPFLVVKQVIYATISDFKSNFHPRPFFTIFCLVSFLILCGLGYWQVQRLEWKLDLINQINTRQTSEPIPIHSVPKEILPWDQLNYQKVIASGNLQLVKSFKVIPRVYQEQIGFHVLTPMRLDNNVILLVNRGWAPEGHKIVNPYWDNENITLQGSLYIPPAQKGHFTPENNPKTKTWYWYDMDEISKSLGYPEIAPAILFVDESFTLRGDEKYPIGGQLNLNQRNWHLWYAITWYTLAGVLFIIWAAFSWKNPPTKTTSTLEENQESDNDNENEPAKNNMDTTTKKDLN